MRIQSLPSPPLPRPIARPLANPPEAPQKAVDLWSDPRPWCPRNQPAGLINETPEGQKTLSGFRWGWTEAPSIEDWQPHFQNTTIDTSKIKDVHFYVEHFFPAGHAALVFEFEEGAIRGQDGRSTDRLVYSIEARKKVGDNWSWQKGLQKTMGMVHQLMTFDDARQWVQRRQGASLETRRLDLSPEQKKAMLDTALQEALKDRTGEYYHTTRNSCYSSLQKVMNKALPEQAVSSRSPLSLGLLMKPEAFLTSSYNTVLKRMDLHHRQQAVFYPPDPTMHPDKHAAALEKLENPGLLTRLGHSPLLAPGMRLAGALVGGGLGYGLTQSLLVAGVAGYIGYKAGAISGDHFEGQALRRLA